MRIAGGRVYLALAWPQLTVLGVLLVVVVVASFQAGVRSIQPPADESADVGEILAGEPSEGEPHAAEPTVQPAHRPTGAAFVPTATASDPARAEQPPTDAPARAPARPAEPFAFKEGYTYVVVQHVSKSPTGRRAAEGIRQFLTSNGVGCVVRLGNSDQDLEVVATEAFLDDQDNDAASAREKRRAEALRQRIRDLGREYNVIGGYSFEGCYLRKF